ncbi:PREDICTED: protein EARLY FLOWERING 3 [Tarenaya hassleriana]|uniref:protein EARLY FLOWERING 3 n=1 Tax=Tarenaya hassleriana TaxID=28532 RepID=UPI00053C8AFB|nr:PREDICTED: protein EARLY FLOWERING 3 [Tarenaya hassleriana]
MKRGRDDEKMMEPLFPRLHVNDADKGGPRAPPRNKMALYEQLSIPSQRFNHQGTVPPGSSNQTRSMERNLYFQHQVSTSVPAHPAEKFVSQKSCPETVRSFTRHDQRQMVGEEDDFMVPVFLNSRREQSHDGTKSRMDKEKPRIVATGGNRSVEIEEVTGKDPKQNGSLSTSSRQEVRDPSKENPRQGASNYSLDLSPRELREAIDVRKSASKCDTVSDAHPRQEARNRLNQEADNGVESQLGGGSLQERDGEASDGLSETSMVDSISSADVSPDDVVGIIGQKRFWKARRAIANQQRVFAVQVFELHRLIKVQKLIAASPHLLLDDGTYLGKSSPIKKLLPGEEYIVKPLPPVKDDSKKDNQHEIECSAENAVGRMRSISSGKNNDNSHQQQQQPPLNYTPCVPPVAPAATTKTQMAATSGGQWCFPQPPAGNHQWLIPVMSPSEGLIYKPYLGPGLTGSGCEGYYSQFMPAPMAVSNFMGGPPVYGMPAPPPPNGFQSPGPGPGPGPAYLPHYAVPSMNVNFSGQHHHHHHHHSEQMNQLVHPNTPSATMSAQQQSSCNFPSSNNNTNVAATTQPQPQSRLAKPRPRKRESNRVLQGSTGSSPGDSGNAVRLFPTGENNRGSLTMTMTTTTATKGAAAGIGTRVIKVVPHNPKAASESAARIFRSIQEERKQYESSF